MMPAISGHSSRAHEGVVHPRSHILKIDRQGTRIRINAQEVIGIHI